MKIEIENSELLRIINGAKDDDIVMILIESEISDNAKREIVEEWIRVLPHFHLRQIETVLREEIAPL
jgi:hypothetical protein